MTLDQLQVLKTIVENGSFRAASEKLHRAQSAISYAIRQLEQESRVELFDRSQYRPQLTEAGKAFYRQGLEVLDHMAQLESFTSYLSQGIEAEVNLSISVLYPTAKLVPVLKQIAADFPLTHINVKVHVLSGDRALLDGQVDLAITDQLEFRDELDLSPLEKVQMIPVVAPNHPLAHIKRAETPRLQAYTQIIISSGDNSDERLAGIARKQRTWSVADFSTKSELLKAGLGWGRMPHHLIVNSLKSGSLVKVGGCQALTSQLNLCTKKGSHLGPASKQLLKLFSASK